MRYTEIMNQLGLHALVFTLIFAPLVALGNSDRLENPLAFGTLYEFLRAILRVVIMIAFPVLVLFIVYVGMLFVTASGNPEKIKTAQKLFFWAVVGGLIVLGAEALSIAIENTVKELGT